MRSAGVVIGLTLAALALADTCPSATGSMQNVTNQYPRDGQYRLLNCASHGLLTDPAPVKSLSSCEADSATACASACANTLNCKTFGYTAATTECALYRKPLVNMGYKQKKQDLGTEFYNLLCFSHFKQLVQDNRFGAVDADGNPTVWTVENDGGTEQTIEYGFSGNDHGTMGISKATQSNTVSTWSQVLERTAVNPPTANWAMKAYIYRNYNETTDSDEPWQFSVTDNGVELFPMQNICDTNNTCYLTAFHYVNNNNQMLKGRQIFLTGQITGTRHELKFNFAFGDVEDFATMYPNGASAYLDQVTYNVTTIAPNFGQ